MFQVDKLDGRKEELILLIQEELINEFATRDMSIRLFHLCKVIIRVICESNVGLVISRKPKIFNKLQLKLLV